MAGKHYTKAELAQREARAAALSKPTLGWPNKPKGLPRSLSREYDQVALDLHGLRILRTTDDTDILAYATDRLRFPKKKTIRVQELEAMWNERKPGVEPDPSSPEIRTSWYTLPCGCSFILEWVSLSQQQIADFLKAIHATIGCEGQGAHREYRRPSQARETLGSQPASEV